mmetsp:Transcript_41307/g.90107  ORF Transcript_41307/g.90107 Transcript_41307/m.90107 type:complete len:143 (-) Transcript_41307:16-444(-)
MWYARRVDDRVVEEQRRLQVKQRYDQLQSEKRTLQAKRDVAASQHYTQLKERRTAHELAYQETLYQRAEKHDARARSATTRRKLEDLERLLVRADRNALRADRMEDQMLLKQDCILGQAEVVKLIRRRRRRNPRTIEHPPVF